jgi:hypothetical protein
MTRMWKWTLNWSVVTEQILVGSCPMRAPDIDAIRQATSATALLSLQHDACLEHFEIDYAAQQRYAGAVGLRAVRYPIRDFDHDALRARGSYIRMALTIRLSWTGYKPSGRCYARPYWPTLRDNRRLRTADPLRRRPEVRP